MTNSPFPADQRGEFVTDYREGAHTLGRVIPEGYKVAALEAADAPALAAAYRRNRRFLEPWEPDRDEDFFTDDGQVAAVAAQLSAVSAGQVVAWLLWCGEEVVGRINLNNIVLGVLRSASVGYWVAEDHGGRGLATGAVEFACAQAQGRGLHRVEAGTLLDNRASQKVLKRCGFEYIGVARRFLFINGAWRDHRLYQRILHDNPL